MTRIVSKKGIVVNRIFFSKYIVYDENSEALDEVRTALENGTLKYAHDFDIADPYAKYF